MGRSDGREGGGAAMAMTAQRRLRRCSDGNGDGGAVMGVAVVAVANQADALSWHSDGLGGAATAMAMAAQ